MPATVSALMPQWVCKTTGSPSGADPSLDVGLALRSLASEGTWEVLEPGNGAWDEWWLLHAAASAMSVHKMADLRSAMRPIMTQQMA
jgi:hypothetical protein